jgi:hypothetical protein
VDAVRAIVSSRERLSFARLHFSTLRARLGYIRVPARGELSIPQALDRTSGG